MESGLVILWNLAVIGRNQTPKLDSQNACLTGCLYREAVAFHSPVAKRTPGKRSRGFSTPKALNNVGGPSRVVFRISC